MDGETGRRMLLMLTRWIVDTQLTPFVTQTMPRTFGQYETKLGPKDPTMYLARWKAENGLD
jgi:hypothetical protein